ncbi:MAG: hypothetical protein GOU97_00730 [Nanoarchaeota archaeon]|nr:hypothetical protein [Nanoarchaeota archaeon]
MKSKRLKNLFESFSNTIMKLRLIITTVLVAFLFCTVMAADYDVENVRASPSIVGEDEYLLLWGRIDNNNLSESTSPDRFEIEITDGDGDHIRNLDPQFHADDGNDKALSTGAFIAKIETDDFDEGETYFITVKIDGLIHYSRQLTLQNTERNVTIKILSTWLDNHDFHSNLKLTNEKDYAQTINLTFIGNGEEQTQTINLEASETKYVESIMDFNDLNVNTGANIIVVTAGYPGGESLPDYAFFMKGTKDYSNYYDAEITCQEEVIRKETINPVPITIKNAGSLTTEFSLSIISGDLKDHASISEEKITLKPGETGKINIVVTVPSNSTLSQTSFTLRVEYAGKTAEKTVYLNIEEKEKTHYFTIEGVTVEKDVYFISEFLNGTIQLKNRGDFDEQITVEYGYSSGVLGTTGVISLTKGQTKNIPFYIYLPGYVENNELELTFTATSKDYSFIAKTNITVQTPVYNFFLVESSPYRNEMEQGNKLNLSFVLFNIGNNDSYTVEADWPYLDLPPKFGLNQGEHKTITVTVHAPNQYEVTGENTITIKVCSAHVETCQEKRYLVNVKTVQESSVVTFPETNELFFEGEVIDYDFVVKNAEDVTRKYQIQVTGLPKDSFTLLPGNEETIFRGQSVQFKIRINNLGPGFHDTTISVYEEGKLMGAKQITVQSKSNGLTGQFVNVASAGVPVIIVIIVGGLIGGWMYMRGRETKVYDYWKKSATKHDEKQKTKKVMSDLRKKVLGLKENLSPKQVKPYTDYFKKV